MEYSKKTPDMKPIGCRFVFKNSGGNIDKHEARLVARRYTQHFEFVITFLALAAKKKWHLTQLDVHNAFFSDDLDEEIYMQIPHGFSIQGEYSRILCVGLRNPFMDLNRPPCNGIQSLHIF